MEIKEKNPVKVVVFAIIMATVNLLFTFIEFSLTSLILLLAFSSLAFFLITKKDKVFVAGALAAIGSIMIISAFSFLLELIDTDDELYAVKYFEGACICLCFCAITIILSVTLLGDKFKLSANEKRLLAFGKICKIISIVVAAIAGLSIVLEIIIYILDEESDFGYFFSCAAYIFGAFALTEYAFPGERKEPKIAKNSEYNVKYTTTDGYISLCTHVCLLLFTFGIWQFIWIYKTTIFTNLAKNEATRNPTAQLLLCIFVPFYMIYWTYKTAIRIDAIAKDKGINSDIAASSLLLAFLIPFVTPFIMQSSINIAVSSVVAANTDDEISIAATLEKYKDLHDRSIITQEEFDAKKKQLLGL